MTIVSNSRSIAEEKPPFVYLRQLAGSYEFVISVSGTIHAQTDASYSYVVHSARVAAKSSSGRLEIGTAFPRMPAIIRQAQNTGFFGFELLLPMQITQLMALEDFRNSSDLNFTVTLSGFSGFGPHLGEREFDHQEWNVHVAESAWVTQLRSANALNILLLEVPMPIISASQKQKAVFEHLQQAQALFADGHYTGCVGECRKAIEELGQNQPNTWGILAKQADREAMGKEERLRAVLSTMHHYSHLAMHSASRGGIADYSRTDAKLMLSLVAAYLAHEANTP